jgi:hypothetical protein
LLRQYEEQIKMLKEQLATGGGGSFTMTNSIALQRPPQSRDNNEDSSMVRQFENEKRQMESLLREKDNMIGKSNLEKDKLASKIQEIQRDMDRKLV